MFKGIISALGGFIGLVQSYFTAKEREKDRDAGRDRERLAQHEEVEDAKNRMDAVDRPTGSDTADKLRNGKF